MNLRSFAKSMMMLVVLGAFLLPRPAKADIKLYLKDGSYQIVKSYKIEGDRVRYYSVERSQWEVVPLSLVDFTTTQRVESETREQRQKILHEAEKTANDTYQLPPNHGVLIAPGIRLPQSNGVFAYDGTRLIRMIQSEGSWERDKKRAMLNLALPGPILKSRSLLVLPGPAAGVRMFNRDPVFYINLPGAHVQLLRVKSRKKDRIIETAEARLSSRPEESYSVLPATRTQVSPSIYRLKPTNPLTPGEYALGEIEGGKLNPGVWDFGIDPLGAKAR